MNRIACAAGAALLLMVVAAQAVVLPYNEHADVKAEIRDALRAATNSHKRVLLIFGANWCEDCVALDHALKEPKNSEFIRRKFEVVKIDVGNFDRNVDVTASYGTPNKEGIPAVAILSADNRVLYVTRAGELANARRIDSDGIHRFFSRILTSLESDAHK